jgi:hypothetical protein
MNMTKESSTSEEVIADCPDTVESDILKTDTESTEGVHRKHHRKGLSRMARD